MENLIHPVLLCGGSGTRLWPLSRKSYPKQFVKLTGDESLYQASARRLSGAGFAAPTIVTAADFRFIVIEQLAALEIAPADILIEPSTKNTAAAICAAALALEAVYFADAVHPEYQTKPAFGWVMAESHPAIMTTPGRGRVNIHGALNLETFDAPFVEPTTVDGASAVQLLAKIEARNPGKRLIDVIWDNAAYHKGPDVRNFLARAGCRIHLIQLPPHCPHLNPIERLWAVMHQCVTHNRHYPTQKQFADAILTFLRETLPSKWETFRDKVTDNFRIMSHGTFRILE